MEIFMARGMKKRAKSKNKMAMSPKMAMMAKVKKAKKAKAKK